MLNFIKITIFIFITIFAGTATLALPGEYKADHEVLTSIDSVRDHAEKQKEMAIRLCEGSREGIIDEQLNKLIKVGLYNDCDQYTDNERFCECTAGVTYKEKLTPKDVKDFEDHLTSLNKRNFAIDGFNALKDYRQERLRTVANIPEANLSLDSSSSTVCDSSQTLSKSLAPFCKESDMEQLKNEIFRASKECQNCGNLYEEITSHLRELPRDQKMSEAQKFLNFPINLVSSRYDKQMSVDNFKTRAISSNDDTKYKSKGDYQYKQLLESIALKIQKKWQGKSSQYPSHVNSKLEEMNKDSALVRSINNHFLTRELPDRPRRNDDFKYENQAQVTTNQYVDYFSDRIFLPLMNKKNASLSYITSLLENDFKLEHAKKLAKHCEQVQEVIKESCAGVSEKRPVLNYDLDKKYANFLRDKNYKNNKFKFDQLYCVAKGKSFSEFFKKTRRGTGKSKINLKFNSEKESRTSLSTLGSSSDYLDFSSGVSIETSLAHSMGTKLKNNSENKHEYEDTQVIIDNALSNSMNVEEVNPQNNSSPVEFIDDVGLENIKGINYRAIINYSRVKTPDEIFIENLNKRAIDEIVNDAVDEMDIEKQIKPDKKNMEIFNPVLKRNLVEGPLTKEEHDLENKEKVSKVVAKEFISDENTLDTLDKIDTLVPDQIKDVSRSVSELLPDESNLNNNFSANYQDAKYNYNSTKSNLSQSRLSQFNRPLTNEEVLENRIKELESELKSAPSEKDINADSKIAKVASPSKNSFSKKTEDSSDDSSEISKMKIELEKVKLELAKSELEAKKKEVQISNSQSPVASSITQAPVENISPTNEINNSNNIFSNNSVKSEKSPSRDSGRSSRSQGSSTSATASSSQSSSNTPSASADGLSSRTSSDNSAAVTTGGRVATTSGGGALLTASQIDEKIIPMNNENSNVSFQDFSEVRSANQGDLEKLFIEFGSQVVTQNGEVILLKKDEVTGEIKVLEEATASDDLIKKASNNRFPASVKESKDKADARKRFSLEEFNQIIDEGVKEE